MRRDDLSCNDAWEEFKATYEKAVEENIPLKPKKKNKPPWLKSSVKKSIKKKYQLFKRYRRTDQYNDYLKYKDQSNKTKKIVRKAQADYEKKLMQGFKTKPKAFYGYVRAKQKVKVGYHSFKQMTVPLPRMTRRQRMC